MEIIKELDQGTEEWKLLRLGKATASNFSKIVTSTGEISKTLREYAIKLASELLVEEVEETYKNAAMQRGNDLEPEARQAYQEEALKLVEEVAFFDCGDWGASPDGLIGDDGIIEIKCPEQLNHTKYLHDNKLPISHTQQCQGLLFCSGRKYLDFVSYNPNFKEGKKLFIVKVERDEEFIKKLEIGIKKVIEIRDNYLKEIAEGEDG
jgi:hypothetical protein